MKARLIVAVLSLFVMFGSTAYAAGGGGLTKHDRQLIAFFENHPKAASTSAGGRILARLLPRVESTIRSLQAAKAAKAKAAAAVPWYVAKQIQVAEIIGHSSETDPWPNCPDPVWNGAASWQDTADCENGGSWLDSPGFYRCGLQFDPSWERIYGRLCP